MQDQSSILSLPLIQPSQAQKHVTHNEALRILDILVQLAVIDRDRTSPPDDPAPGDRHIVGAGATGAWSGADMQIAIWEEGGWGFLDPRPGWRAEVLSEARGRVFDGTGWVVRLPELDHLPGLGLNTASDAANRLAVAASATLLTHEGAGHQLKLNKAAPGDTASLLFQTGFSGRAEMGTAGNDDWSIKVSPDGITWTEALRVEAASGRVTGQAIQASATDITAGRIMRADFGYGPGNILGLVSQSGGVPTGALVERGNNANGDYVRFADGSQTCWKTFTFADLAPDVIAQQTWTFPASFVTGVSPNVQTQHVGAGIDASLLSGFSPIGASGAEIFCGHSLAATQTRFVMALATGRWF